MTMDDLDDDPMDDECGAQTRCVGDPVCPFYYAGVCTRDAAIVAAHQGITRGEAITNALEAS